MMLSKTFTKMDVHTFLFGFLVLQTILPLSSGRGKMVEPPQRSSLWRHEEWYGKPMVATNTDDGGLNCGGYWKLHEVNQHRCGLCGDAFDNKDRPNEAGGRFAQGYIARTYYHDKNKLINVTVDIKANIGGYFEFRLCPNNDIHKKITQECLDKHHLVINGYGHRFYVERDTVYDLQLKIPEDLVCTQCVLQWKWKGSHYWGMCDDGYGGIGCGDQEEYYNCADIAILTSNGTRNVTADKNGTTTVIPEVNDTKTNKWISGPEMTTQASWDSENGLSTPSWLQDLLLVASEMGKPKRHKNHKKHSDTKSVLVSGAIPVLNLPNVTATPIPVHNITTLNGSDFYPNVTYEIGNSTDQTNNTAVEIGESEDRRNKSVMDTNISNQTNMANDTETRPNLSIPWVGPDESLTVGKKPDTPLVQGIPISDAFLRTDYKNKPSTNFPWENSVVTNENSLSWNQRVQNTPGDKTSKTYWAVTNVSGSNTVDQTVDQNEVNQIPNTSPPSKKEQATTGTLFNLYSTTTGVGSGKQQTLGLSTTESSIPEQTSDAAFKQRIGPPGIPIFAQDFLNMEKGTISSSPPPSTSYTDITHSSPLSTTTVVGPGADAINQPVDVTTVNMETTDVRATEYMSTLRPKFKSPIDEFAINTENMPHILKDITTPKPMTAPKQYITTSMLPFISKTASSVWDAEMGSLKSIPTNDTDIAVFESSNNSVSAWNYSKNDSIAHEESTTQLEDVHTAGLHDELINSTTIPFINISEETNGPANHTETPLSTSVAEVQLISPEIYPTTNINMETTPKGIIPDFETSTTSTITNSPFDLITSTDSNYGPNAMVTERKGDNTFVRNENDLDILMQNITDLLKNSSGTENLNWILTGHMTDKTGNSEGIPIPTFNPAEITGEGGNTVKTGSRKNDVNARAAIMQTYRASPKAEVVIRPTNFSAQNKSAYRTNMFTGPSNIKPSVTTTESLITPRNPTPGVYSTLAPNDLSANTGFQNQQGTKPSAGFSSKKGIQGNTSPMNEIYLKPDMILPRGSISFKNSGEKHREQGANIEPNFHNNGQLSFGGQDIIDAGRTVGIPLSQIRPGKGGVLSDGRQIISGLDFVDTDLQYETGNRTIAMPLVGNTVGSPSRQRSMTSSKHVQITSGQTSISEQSPVAMRQISHDRPIDKVGGSSFMHPPPPSKQLSMQPSKVIEEIMRKLTPGQSLRMNERQLG